MVDDGGTIGDAEGWGAEEAWGDRDTAGFGLGLASGFGGKHDDQSTEVGTLDMQASNNGTYVCPETLQTAARRTDTDGELLLKHAVDHFHVDGSGDD